MTNKKHLQGITSMLFSNWTLRVEGDDLECGSKSVEQDSEKEESTALSEGGGSWF